MAPTKSNKRTTSAGPAASPRKKGRVSPMFAGIVATLQSADDLSENCRDMLVAMASPCLSTLKSERHSLQVIGVTMIEEKLQDHQKKLIEAVGVAQAELAKLEGSKNTLMQSLEEAKTSHESKKAECISALSVREEAKEAVKAAQGVLAEAKEAQKQGDAKYDDLQKQKVAIEAAYLEHFKTPMEANEGPHHKNLKPFIATLGLEDSLTSALPSSCTKSKDQRGGFDDLVLTELGKALEKKIADLTQSIAEEEAGVSERKASVESAEAVLESKNQAEKTAVADLEVAATAQHAAEEVEKKALEEWTTFEPRVQEATDNCNLQDTKRIDFEEGPLKDFMNLRDKEAAPVEEEAATAGA